MTARVFGQRFCTFCGKNTMLYYTWEEDGKTRVIGDCECGNIDYCDGETEADVKRRFGAHLKPSKYKYLELI